MKKADLESGRSGVSEESSLLGSARIGVESTKSLLTAVPLIDDTCVMTYDPVDLTSLWTLCVIKGTIFGQGAMWYVLIITFTLTCIIAFGIIRLIDHYDHINPESFSTDTISSVIRSVTVAMAFLLGLFVNNAMSRWWEIIRWFERLFGASKRLSQNLINIDAPKDVREEVARRTILSIEMLRFEKTVEKMPGDPADNWREQFDELAKEKHLSSEERKCLEQVGMKERSFFCWSLVSKSVKLAKGSAGELYKGLHRVTAEGSAAVGALKTVSNFQFPYLYVHMLAWMVHLVNILTAVGAGITIGIIVARARVSPKDEHGNRESIDASVIFKEFLFLFIQVFLYQAFLGIGAALSYPVVPAGHGAMYRLPLQEMIVALRKTLATMNRLADEKLL